MKTYTAGMLHLKGSDCIRAYITHLVKMIYAKSIFFFK